MEENDKWSNCDGDCYLCGPDHCRRNRVPASDHGEEARVDRTPVDCFLSELRTDGRVPIIAIAEALDGSGLGAALDDPAPTQED